MPVSIQLESDQVGKREDLSDLIATADRKNTPFFNQCPKSAIPKNVVFQWQMDKYNDPTADTSKVSDSSGAAALLGTSSVVDGTDQATTGDVFAETRTRKLAQNFVHTFQKATRIGFLAEDVSTVAGAPSELARSVARRIVEMKREIEKHMMSGSNAIDQVASSSGGHNVTGYKTKALGSFIHEDGKSTNGGTEAASYTVNSAFQPSAGTGSTAAGVFTGAIGTFSEEVVQNMLEGIYNSTGTARDYTGIVGTTLKRKFTNLASTNTVNSTIAHTADPGSGPGTELSAYPGIAADRTRTVTKDQGSKNYTSVVNIFEGDFGQITLLPSHFTDHASNGYIIPFDEVSLKIHTAPNVSELTNNGGGEARLLRAIMGLAVNNPLSFGRFRSDATHA